MIQASRVPTEAENLPSAPGGAGGEVQESGSLLCTSSWYTPMAFEISHVMPECMKWILRMLSTVAARFSSIEPSLF